jgi:putative endonuclease
VTPAKLARLGRLAEAWQRAHGVTAPEVRIDLVGIVRPRRGAATVDHVRGLV